MEEVSAFNRFFSDCRYMPQLRRYSPTKFCNGAKMAIFWVLYFQRATCSTFQTSILNLHKGHTMCGSMVDIQSPTAEIRQGKKRTRKKPQGKNVMFCPTTQGDHKNCHFTTMVKLPQGNLTGQCGGPLWTPLPDEILNLFKIQESLQCFDTIGWALGRGSDRKKLSDEVLAWLPVWSEVQVICIWSSWCYCHSIISCFIKLQDGLTFLVLAYPGCPGVNPFPLCIHYTYCSPSF